MSEIIYPTLDLFLYDLRDGLGENAGEIADNKDRFLQKLPERIRSAIEQRDAAVEAEYVELLGNRGREQFNSSSQKYTLKGYYYPVRLGDSYGLLLDCSVEHSLGHPDRSQTEAFLVSCFADLKAELDRRLADSKSTIGQVWMYRVKFPTLPRIELNLLPKLAAKFQNSNSIGIGISEAKVSLREEYYLNFGDIVSIHPIPPLILSQILFVTSISFRITTWF